MSKSTPTVQRLLLCGSGLSGFGSWIDFIAVLTLAANTYQVTPYGMVAVGAVGLLPGIVFAGPLGRLCDSQYADRVLIVSLIARVLATLGMYCAPNFLTFVGLAAVRAAFSAATPLATNVIAVRRLDAITVLGFFARKSLLANISKILAPAMGAALASRAGEGSALLLAALMEAFAIPIFAYLAFRYESVGSNRHSSESTDGPAPRCRALCWMVGIYFAFVFMTNNQLPLLLSAEGFEPSFFGVLVSCSGLGNVLVGVWMSAHSKTRGAGSLMTLCLASVIQAVGLVVIAFVFSSADGTRYVLMPLAFVVAGMASAYFAICTAGIISERHRDAVGRVSAEVQRWQHTMMIVAPLVGAYVFDVTSAGMLLLVAGAFGLIATSLFADVYVLGRRGNAIRIAP